MKCEDFSHRQEEAPDSPLLCPPSLGVLTGILMNAITGLQNVDIEWAAGEKFCDLEYAEFAVCLSEYTEDVQIVLDRMTSHTASLVCTLRLRRWSADIDCSTDRYVTNDGSVLKAIIARICKVRAEHRTQTPLVTP
ncbi:unnamed protein product [Echinostoma caproni]|uniref:PB1 domain-containing protein n=1 Tax=Echinostoma caproni TaxID=27848 RepID=A0A183AFU5_9TREM|nr:unnamed protein product [Echinostoma caproni]